jgi:hypothetical protein
VLVAALLSLTPKSTEPHVNGVTKLDTFLKCLMKTLTDLWVKGGQVVSAIQAARHALTRRNMGFVSNSKLTCLYYQLNCSYMCLHIGSRGYEFNNKKIIM